ncbi:hypothetical protein ACFSQT_38390 [Mesorhizobium calcicola]|uniref:Transposase n=1 Tax=Mesorhizobium calcicola TaxID=1300310 RepID=A0ABW4WRZ9_9HYPH
MIKDKSWTAMVKEMLPGAEARSAAAFGDDQREITAVQRQAVGRPWRFCAGAIAKSA